MRGYKPSRFRKPVEQSVDDRDRAKRENMSQYMDRVAEGLPLFGENSPTPKEANPKSKAVPIPTKSKSKTKAKAKGRKVKT